MVIALLTMACGGGAGPSVDASAPASQELSAAQWLVRASLDLRGVRPSAADLLAVAADPDAAATLVDAYAQDPRFGRRVALHYATVLQARVDVGDHEDPEYRFDQVTAVLSAMGEEPLRLIQEVADRDLPWTTVTTADWTMVDPTLAERYPVAPVGAEADGDDQGWGPATWTDGRPAAGLLSTNGLYWRHPSAGFNDHRGRANVLTRALLCVDYLDRAVAPPEDLDLTDEDAVKEAIVTVEACVGCHVVVDPIGAYMWGFQRQDPHALLDLVSYSPQDEWLWEDTDVSPAFYGQPGQDLVDLGHQVADDPRLLSCAVQRALGLAWGREITLEDTARVTALREVFIAGDLTLRPLLRAAVDTPEYRARPGTAERAVDWKVATPDLMVSQVEGLTGFRASTEDLDLWDSDVSGLRSMAGAGRSYGATPATMISPAAVLVQARLAEAAAAWTVGEGRSGQPATLLLGELDLDDPDPPELSGTMQHLWRTVLSREVASDSAEVRDTVALWEGLVDGGVPPADAWAAVLSGLLRHPDLLVY